MSRYPTVVETAEALDRGIVSSSTLTKETLARINDPAGEGVRVYIRRNDQRAVKLAEASDTLRTAGIKRSPLEGVPISVKDLFDIAGETTLAGSIALKDAPAAQEIAPVVQRLIAAGAVITGTTNMSEFAFFRHRHQSALRDAAQSLRPGHGAGYRVALRRVPRFP